MNAGPTSRSGFIHKESINRKSLLRPELRGGDKTSLRGSADYSDAARVLFGNIISPAAMLTGGLVPLGFLAEPPPGDKPWQKKIRCIYFLLSVLSLANELMAIMYATVASNKLTETVTAPAESVFALIKRDYELPWVATNVHFMFGLIGFIAMIMVRALTIYPKSLNSAAAGLAGAAALAMCSVLNVGVSEGDGHGDALGGNMLSLVARYVVLLVKQLRAKKGIIATASIVLAFVSSVRAVRNLLAPESQ